MSGCIEEFGGVGEPFNRTEQVSGTWKLNVVQQVDELAVERNWPYQRLNLTNLFPYQDLTMTLNLDDSGNPSGFSVNQGNAPAIIPFEAGQWAFDDQEFPGAIIFSSGDQSTTLEFESLNELNVNRLVLKLARYQTDAQGKKKAFVSYNYEFVKQLN